MIFLNLILDFLFSEITSPPHVVPQGQCVVWSLGDPNVISWFLIQSGVPRKLYGSCNNIEASLMSLPHSLAASVRWANDVLNIVLGHAVTLGLPCDGLMATVPYDFLYCRVDP